MSIKRVHYIKYKANGMISVEGAIVIPIVLCSIVMSMYLVMYMHDIVVANAYVCKYVNELSYKEASNIEYSNQLREIINKETLVCDIKEFKFEKNNKNYKIYGILVASGFGSQLFGNYTINAQSGVEMSADVIRRVKVTREIWK